LPPNDTLNLKCDTFIAFAVIQEAKGPVDQHPSGLNMHIYKKLESIEVVDITTVRCLVGRVRRTRDWVIFDRSTEDTDSEDEEEGEESEGMDED
jgi:hypothetical protein